MKRYITFKVTYLDPPSRILRVCFFSTLGKCFVCRVPVVLLSANTSALDKYGVFETKSLVLLNETIPKVAENSKLTSSFSKHSP